MLRNTISNFPKDLNETYERILAKVFQSSRNDDMRTVLVRVFRWVLGARRPLTVAELEEAVALEKNDNYLRFDRVASNSGERLIANCGNLVILNENDSTVAFAHHTVQQYLCSMPSNHPFLVEDVLSLKHANHEIGQICLAYLSFSDFETQLIKVATNPVELKKAEQLVWSNVPLGKYIKRTLLGSSRSRETATNIPSEEHTIRFPLPTRSQPSHIMNRKYAMLDYIISTWVWHTAHLTTGSENWAKFQNVVTQRNLIFNFRPWKETEHQIKVQQFFSSALKSGKIQTSVSRGEDLSYGLVPQEVLVYCFLMRHGIRSLLPLVDRATLLQCVKHYQAPSRHITLEQCLQYLSAALHGAELSQWQHVSFWNGHLIYHLMMKGDVIGNPFAVRLAILNFASTEYKTWVDSYTDKMFSEAILLALQADKVDIISVLMRSYVTTPARFVETLLLVIGESHDRIRVMRLILFLPIDINEPWSSELMWKYLFVLHHCLVNLGFIFERELSAMAAMNQFTSRALLALAVGVFKLPKLVRQISKVHNPRSLILDEIDWKSQAYGTAELYHALKPLSGSSLEYNAGLILEIADLCSPTASHWSDREWSNAIKAAGPFFSIEAFEEDQISCLVAAIKAHCLDVVKTLVPMYVDFLQDANNYQASVEIIRAIGISKRDFSSIKDVFVPISWPARTKLQVRDKFAQELRLGTQGWIIDMVLAS